MTEPRALRHRLQLRDLELALHLGCTAEERQVPQEVRVSAAFEFARAPVALKSDLLEDTLCYARFSEAIERHCHGREFNLIERVADELYALLREMAGPGVSIGLKIHKVRPPVPRLLGGSIYEIGDFFL